MGLVMRPRQCVVVGVEPSCDPPASLVTPNLGLAQRGESGDRDVLVNVAWVPPEGSGGPSTGVQLPLQGVEGFSTGEAKALRCVAREAICGSEQCSLAVDQEDCVRVVRDQAEGVYKAPKFG